MKKLKFSNKVVAASIIAALGTVVIGITAQYSLAEEKSGAKNHRQVIDNYKIENNEGWESKSQILKNGEGCGMILNQDLAYCNNSNFSIIQRNYCRERAYRTYDKCMGR